VTVAVYGHRKTINTVDGGEPYSRRTHDGNCTERSDDGLSALWMAHP
jgi:hypothetical protein